MTKKWHFMAWLVEICFIWLRVAGSWPPLESSGISSTSCTSSTRCMGRFGRFAVSFRECKVCKLQFIAFEGQVADLITMTLQFSDMLTPVDSRENQKDGSSFTLAHPPRWKSITIQKNGCFLMDDDLSLLEKKRLVICRTPTVTNIS